MKISESIAAARKGFEESFAKGSFYDRQTQDREHLEKILSFLPIRPGMRILDLGTGSGYLAFAVAKRFPETLVTGLDIVREALAADQKRAETEGLANLNFIVYDGMEFPFTDASFDLVVSRYALHHFPVIKRSVKEIFRSLRTGGYFFLSDQTPNEDDIRMADNRQNNTKRFVDAYMQLKKDGHIKFYSCEEWKDICKEAGFDFCDSFNSSIRFPKKKETAYGFLELLEKYPEEIIKSYELEMTGDEIFVTEPVNNLLFQKR